MSEKSECTMELVEDAEFNLTWECYGCGTAHKATDKFERSKTCPACGATIRKWVGLYGEDEGAP